jgi:hypothetical protein
MIIPNFKQITFHKNIFIERSLPDVGKILVSESQNVEDYTKLGYSKNSIKELVIPSGLKINSKILSRKNIKMGELLAFKNNKYLFAPFDGVLETRGKSFVLIKNPEDSWLISGVSGRVAKIYPFKSVLIETSGFEIKLVASSYSICEGVLDVLPNPSELIEIEFMEKYIKNGIGKVVYTGNFLRKEMLIKAMEIGCEGILTSSCDRETLYYAKENNYFVGVLSGFGRIPVSRDIMDFLKRNNSKYAIIRDGSQNIFVSDRLTFYKNDPSYINIKIGTLVRVLDYPYYGWEGKVVKIENDLVYVRIVENDEVIKTHHFNLIA